MSQKRSSVGSKIDFRVQQSYHSLNCRVPIQILLDFKKRCQAVPSIANSIIIELPTAHIVHIKLADVIKQAHGFRSLRQSEGDIMSPLRPPPFSKVIEISFDSLEDVMAFAQSNPLEGKDHPKSLGVVMLIYDVSDM